jgi:hypothetical protein
MRREVIATCVRGVVSSVKILASTKNAVIAETIALFGTVAIAAIAPF